MDNNDAVDNRSEVARQRTEANGDQGAAEPVPVKPVIDDTDTGAAGTKTNANATTGGGTSGGGGDQGHAGQ